MILARRNSDHLRRKNRSRSAMMMGKLISRRTKMTDQQIPKTPTLATASRCLPQLWKFCQIYFRTRKSRFWNWCCVAAAMICWKPSSNAIRWKKNSIILILKMAENWKNLQEISRKFSKLVCQKFSALISSLESKFHENDKKCVKECFTFHFFRETP